MPIDPSEEKEETAAEFITNLRWADLTWAETIIVIVAVTLLTSTVSVAGIFLLSLVETVG